MHNYSTVVVTSCIYTTVAKLCQIIPEKLYKDQVLPNVNKGRKPLWNPKAFGIHLTVLRILEFRGIWLESIALCSAAYQENTNHTKYWLFCTTWKF